MYTASIKQRAEEHAKQCGRVRRPSAGMGFVGVSVNSLKDVVSSPDVWELIMVRAHACKRMYMWVCTCVYTYVWVCVHGFCGRLRQLAQRRRELAGCVGAHHGARVHVCVCVSARGLQ